jgi:hypothetical protein
MPRLTQTTSLSLILLAGLAGCCPDDRPPLPGDESAHVGPGGMTPTDMDCMRNGGCDDVDFTRGGAVNEPGALHPDALPTPGREAETEGEVGHGDVEGPDPGDEANAGEPGDNANAGEPGDPGDNGDNGDNGDDGASANPGPDDADPADDGGDSAHGGDNEDDSGSGLRRCDRRCEFNSDCPRSYPLCVYTWCSATS